MKKYLYAAMLASLAAAPAQAQQREPANCTWETCALRIRSATLTKPPTLVRGTDEHDVAPIAPFGQPIAGHFELSDAAFQEALRYDRIQPVAGVLNIAGPLLLVIAPFLTDWSDRPVSSAALMVGGFGMTLYGTQLGNRAQDALSRAIWHYNGSIAR